MMGQYPSPAMHVLMAQFEDGSVAWMFLPVQQLADGTWLPPENDLRVRSLRKWLEAGYPDVETGTIRGAVAVVDFPAGWPWPPDGAPWPPAEPEPEIPEIIPEPEPEPVVPVSPPAVPSPEPPSDAERWRTRAAVDLLETPGGRFVTRLGVGTQVIPVTRHDDWWLVTVYESATTGWINYQGWNLEKVE